MSSRQTDFYPFYDPLRDGVTLSYPSKIGISLGMGAFYVLLQYFSLPDKMVFFQQYSWILGVIISTSIMALYLATDVFRRSLVTINQFEGDNRISNQIIETWLTDRWYLMAGAGFSIANTSIAHLLGVPADIQVSVLATVIQYLGFVLAGFSAGMGLWGIISIIVLYLKFAPNLQHNLDPEDPDGIGGIKKLGDSLWFFSLLIFTVGILVSVYMFGVDWEYMFRGYVRGLFLFWVALPYLVAISIVLIPGLAVRRQVNQYKSYREVQLKQEKAQLYSSYKEFREADDDEIIATKKELNDKMNHISEQMEKLRKMRSSHLGGQNKE